MWGWKGVRRWESRSWKGSLSALSCEWREIERERGRKGWAERGSSSDRFGLISATPSFPLSDFFHMPDRPSNGIWLKELSGSISHPNNPTKTLNLTTPCTMLPRNGISRIFCVPLWGVCLSAYLTVIAVPLYERPLGILNERSIRRSGFDLNLWPRTRFGMAPHNGFIDMHIK
jgi:hypothetical protein